MRFLSPLSPLALLSPFAVLSLVACGTEPRAPPEASAPEFGSAVLVDITSASGALHIELRTDPQPPVVGDTFAQYRVVDEDGAAVGGLTLEISPYMPAMGMGTDVVPSVSEEGEGIYLVSDVDLMMPGLWELRTHFTGDVEDDAAPAFDVP